MNLFLYNQTRDRDLGEYLKRLRITRREYERINIPDSKILIIGLTISLVKKIVSKH